MIVELAEFGWTNADATCAHDYLLPAVVKSIQTIYGDRQVRILDVGCGNGYVGSRLLKLGHQVTGMDASSDGIVIARTEYPQIEFQTRSVYEDEWPEAADPFDCVLSLEVIEHLMYPKALFEKAFKVIHPGGHLILSTPYHGYLKNLALSLVNGWDKHWNVQWDGGHIKFFSAKTLRKMASDAGFRNIEIFGVGRVPLIWKSMILVADK